MTVLETILAFLTVMGVIAIPISAIVTRRNSPIGQAMGDRIRRKTERKLGPPSEQTAEGRRPAEPPEVSGNEPSFDPVAIIEDQQQSLHEMSARLEFLERLIEKEQSGETSPQ